MGLAPILALLSGVALGATPMCQCTHLGARWGLASAGPEGQGQAGGAGCPSSHADKGFSSLLVSGPFETYLALVERTCPTYSHQTDAWSVAPL